MKLPIIDRNGRVRGHVLIDPEDAELVSKYHWHISAGYARTRTGGKRILMHRLITNAPDHLDVDHINGNRLDNRKSNLRFTNHRLNMLNRSNWGGVKGLRGVYQKRGKFQAQIRWHGKLHTLGTFDTPEEAHEAYQAARARFVEQELGGPREEMVDS